MKKDTVSLTDAERQLLALTRASLWRTPVDMEAFSTGAVDWHNIWTIAFQQTVCIPAIEGAMGLPEALLPPKEWRNRGLAFMECNRRTHLKIDGCVGEAVSRLDTAGVRTVLLKGQAYARAYTHSWMRQCGDIDLYVGDDCYFKAYSAVNGFGWLCEEKFMPESKHYGCSLNGVRIELHRKASLFPQSQADSRFMKWSEMQLNSASDHLDIGGARVTVPPPLFNVVFVFVHLYLHFIRGGIGLRHICDWTMLLNAHFNEINSIELENVLNQLHLMNAWLSFAPIAVEHLGLPSCECPFYSPEYRKKGEAVLSIIMKEGNFGRASRRVSKRPAGYMAGKVDSFMRHTGRLCSIFRVDPWMVIRVWRQYLRAGIIQIFKDMKTQMP